MTKFWVFGERERRRLIFRIFFWNCTLALHIKLEQVLRPTDVLNRPRYVRNSTVKYKVFYETTTATATGESLNKRIKEQNNGCARAL